ncbi:MAG: alpha/beta fold hydrolase [Saprospiraceae bacterium]|nr:alpha/beta fold hydrolase [Saprospiraceae bacterium]
MKDILLLHGALGDVSQLYELGEHLNPSYKVHILDFSGHGKNGYDGPLDMEILVRDIKVYLDGHGLQSVYVFGYSMGGYAALKFALLEPDRIAGLFTYGTKFNWEREAAMKEISMLDAEVMEQKIPAFAEQLKLRHIGRGWRSLLEGTAGIMLGLADGDALTDEEISCISTPVCIGWGTKDRMVSLEESAHVAGVLPLGRLLELEAQPHPLDKVDIKVLADMLERFLANPPDIYTA